MHGRHLFWNKVEKQGEYTWIGIGVSHPNGPVRRTAANLVSLINSQRDTWLSKHLEPPKTNDW